MRLQCALAAFLILPAAPADARESQVKSLADIGLTRTTYYDPSERHGFFIIAPVQGNVVPVRGDRLEGRMWIDSNCRPYEYEVPDEGGTRLIRCFYRGDRSKPVVLGRYDPGKSIDVEWGDPDIRITRHWHVDWDRRYVSLIRDESGRHVLRIMVPKPGGADPDPDGIDWEVAADEDRAFEGKVVRVIDHGTLKLSDHPRPRVVRLGVTCAKRRKAKRLVQKRVFWKDVRVLISGLEDDGTITGEVYRGERSLNLELLESGLGCSSDAD